MSNVTVDLTCDEQVLHHHESMVKKKLEAYHARKLGDEVTWIGEFREFMKKSLNYYVVAQEKSATSPRVHPLLLSLFVVLKKSRDSPDIGSVTEDDPRVKDHTHYTSPSDLPPLNIHVPDKNATCPACIISELQDNSNPNSVATNIPPVVYGQEDIPSEPAKDSAEVSIDTVDNALGNGKGRRQVSSGTVRKIVTRSTTKANAVGHVKATAGTTSKGAAGGNENVISYPQNILGRRSARLQERVKGNKWPKRGRKPGNKKGGNEDEDQDEDYQSEENNSSTKEDKNEKATILSQDESDNGNLKIEVQTLKNRCDRYEKMIKDLQSKCETHETFLEMLRKDVVGILSAQKRLDTTYKGKSYELTE